MKKDNQTSSWKAIGILILVISLLYFIKVICPTCFLARILNDIDTKGSLAIIVLTAGYVFTTWRQIDALRDEQAITKSQAEIMKSQLDIMSKSLTNQTSSLLYPDLYSLKIDGIMSLGIPEANNSLKVEIPCIVSIDFYVRNVGPSIALNSIYFLEIYDQDEVYFAKFSNVEVIPTNENCHEIINDGLIDKGICFIKNIVDGSKQMHLRVITLCSDIYGTGFIGTSEKAIYLKGEDELRRGRTLKNILQISEKELLQQFSQSNDLVESLKSSAEKLVSLFEPQMLFPISIYIGESVNKTSFNICDYTKTLLCIEAEATKKMKQSVR